jgi:PAS domain S-box-containing protein
MDIRHRTYLALIPLLIVSVALVIVVPLINSRISELAGTEVETLNRLVNTQDLELLTLKQRNNIDRMVRGFAIYQADYSSYRQEIDAIMQRHAGASSGAHQQIGRQIVAAYAELDRLQEETVAAVLRGDLAVATSTFIGPAEAATHALLGATTAAKQRDRSELARFEQSARHLGQKSLVYLGAGVGVAVALALVLSWLLMLDILRPIEVLAGDALRYSSGDTPGELSPVRRIKQLQHLRDSFQRLLDLTLARQERLARANRDLEERTEELRKNSAQLRVELAERERAELALRESERRFQAFLDNSPSPTWITDEHDRLIYVSKPARELFDAGARGAVGEHIAALLPSAWADRYSETARRARLTNEVVEDKIGYVRQDGAPSYALCHLFAIDIGGRRLVGGSSLDITARVVAEEQIKRINEELERRVRERTAELEAAQKELVETARQAGMAEVATNVLHNVGNVLNSVNVSVALLKSRVRGSKVDGVHKIAQLVSDHAHDLPEFLSQPRRTEQIVEYMKVLSKVITDERDEVLVTVEELTTSAEHLKALVQAQQRYAGRSSFIEKVSLSELVDQALRMNDLALPRSRVRLVKEVEDIGPALLDQHKLLQVLMNLLSNAKHAMDEVSDREHVLTVRVSRHGEGRVRLCVNDTGIGIPPENMERLFRHGFTTRAHGHGFGLHSCLIAAGEMGGKLTVESEGAGRGATFTLELPLLRT